MEMGGGGRSEEEGRWVVVLIDIHKSMRSVCLNRNTQGTALLILSRETVFAPHASHAGVGREIW